MKNILVVEDNAANRELLQEVLALDGYQVREAVDGREALAQVESATPDLVLLDLQVPKLDGYGVLQELRADARWAKLPVVAVTAFAMRGDREKALAVGFDAYVTKPIDTAALRRELKRLLG